VCVCVCGSGKSELLRGLSPQALARGAREATLLSQSRAQDQQAQLRGRRDELEAAIEESVEPLAEQRERLDEQLARRVEVEAELAAGEAPVLLLYAKEDDENGPSDYLPWCQAYLAGVDAADEDWFEFLGEKEGDDAEDNEEESEEISYLDERLFPLMVLTGEAEGAAREHGEEWPEGEEREQITSDCEDDLQQAVTDIYRFWLAKRGTQTIRRDEPKVGRNDPCPCGSGKKFKQCCGAEL